MNRSQTAILWIGVMVVVVFLFTDVNFRNKLFNRGNQATTVSAPYSLADIIGTTGVPANSPSTGTAKVVGTTGNTRVTNA